jgi:hypothetical protein
MNTAQEEGPMSDQERISTSLRDMPKSLYERIKAIAAQELNGLGLSINQTMMVLLLEAIEQREREGRNSGKIEDSIVALDGVT